MKIIVSKGIGILVLLSSLIGVFLFFGNKAEAALPTGHKLKMYAYTLDGEFKGAYYATENVGWEYAYISDWTAHGIYLESRGNNTYRIRATSPRWTNYDYWTVSARGYIYLGERGYAEDFSIVRRSDGYYNIHDKAGYPLNTFNWAATPMDFITTGEATGWRRTKWAFIDY